MRQQTFKFFYILKMIVGKSPWIVQGYNTYLVTFTLGRTIEYKMTYIKILYKQRASNDCE